MVWVHLPHPPPRGNQAPSHHGTIKKFEVAILTWTGAVARCAVMRREKGDFDAFHPRRRAAASTALPSGSPLVLVSRKELCNAITVS